MQKFIVNYQFPEPTMQTFFPDIFAKMLLFASQSNKCSAWTGP